MTSQTTGRPAESRTESDFDLGSATARERNLVSSGQISETELRELIEYDSDPDAGPGEHAIPAEPDAEGAVQDIPAAGPEAGEQTDDGADGTPDDPDNRVAADGQIRPAPESGMEAEDASGPRPAENNPEAAPEPQPSGEDTHNRSDQRITQEEGMDPGHNADDSVTDAGPSARSEPPHGTEWMNGAHDIARRDRAADGMAAGPALAPRAKAAGLAAQLSLRRSVIYASILIAAGFGAVGFFAGSPKTLRSDLSAPADPPSFIPRDMPEPAIRMVSDAQTDAAAAVEEKPAASVIQETQPPAIPSETDPELVIVPLEVNGTRLVSQPSVEDGPARRDNLFLPSEESREFITAGSATVGVLAQNAPAQLPKADDDALGGNENGISGSANPKPRAHDMDTGTRLTNGRTAAAEMAEPTGQATEPNQGITAGAGADGSGRGPVQPDPLTPIIEIIAAGLIAIDERVQSAEDRIRLLEQSQGPGAPPMADAGSAEDKAVRPLIGAEAGEESPTQENEKAAVPRGRYAERFMLTSVSGGDAPPAWRTAEAGDVIDGYGTVTAVIRYEGGGAMLLTENGALFVN